MNSLQIVTTSQFAARTSIKPHWGLNGIASVLATGKPESWNAGKPVLPCRFSALPVGGVFETGIEKANRNKDIRRAYSGFPLCRMKNGEVKIYLHSAFSTGYAINTKSMMALIGLCPPIHLESRNTGIRLLSCRFSALPVGGVFQTGIEKSNINNGLRVAYSGFPLCRMKHREVEIYLLATFSCGGHHEF